MLFDSKALSSRLRLAVAVLAASGMVVVGMTAPPNAVAETRPVAELDGQDDLSAEVPDLVVSPGWESISTAFLSPKADPRLPEDVTNAANSQSILRLSIKRPEKGTRLRLQLQPEGQDQLVEFDELLDFRGTSAILSEVCVRSSIRPTGAVGQSFIECTLDPDQWGEEEGVADHTGDQPVVAAKATGDKKRVLQRSGLAKTAFANQIAQADASQALRSIVVGFAGYDPEARRNDNGSVRARNLDSWLVGLSDGSLGGGAAEGQEVTVAKAAILTDSDGNEIASADLSWNQCFVAESESLARASCSPKVASQLVFAPSSGQKGDVVPADTTTNQGWGRLVPGKRWNGNISVFNSGAFRGWAGLGPFADGSDDDFRTQYVLTNFAPQGAENVRVLSVRTPASSEDDCREVARDGQGQLREGLPEEIGHAGSVCGLEQKDPLQPVLVSSDPGTGGFSSWQPTDRSNSEGEIDYGVSYKVPLNMLEVAANDPEHWELREQEVEQLRYTDDEGQPLKEPELVKVKIAEYASRVSPQFWGWVPNECGPDAEATGDEGNPIVCAASAEQVTNPPAGTKDNLHLVPMATADEFERRICEVCWPAPNTFASAWTNPERQETADRPGKSDSVVMQGQSGFVSVNVANTSQTPGDWSRSKLVVEGVPDDVEVVADRLKLLPSDGAGAPWPDDESPEVEAMADAVQCAVVSGDAADGRNRWECTITDDKKKLAGVGLPALFESGAYAFLLRMEVGKHAPIKADEESYRLDTYLEYPNYLHDTDPVGVAEQSSVALQVIPEAEAILGLTSTIRSGNDGKTNAKKTNAKNQQNKWKTYNGKPLEIALTNPADDTTKDWQQVPLRYEFSNQGQRWIRPNDELRFHVKLPPGVNPNTPETNFDVGAGESKGLKDLGEQWSCDKKREEEHSSDYGFDITWDVWTVDCSSTVSEKRKRRGWQAPDQEDDERPVANYPSVLLTLTGAVESPSDDDASQASVSAYRLNPDTGQMAEISAPLAANPNAGSNLPIRIVDVNAYEPTIQPYWLVRPVAGGHASARIDIANIHRGAAANMNLLLSLSNGAEFPHEAQMVNESTGEQTVKLTTTQGTRWDCSGIRDGDGKISRAACRYDAGLAKDDDRKSKEPPRTAPLFVDAAIAADAQGSFQLLAEASVFRIPFNSPMGAQSGGLGYEIGQPIDAVATTTSDDGLAESFEVGASPNDAISFTDDIDQPDTRASVIQLDASQSTTAFDGQYSNISWKQLCVDGSGDDCPQGTSPVVALLPSATVLNPSFTAPDVEQSTTLTFQVTMSDPLEPTESIPERVKTIKWRNPETGKEEEINTLDPEKLRQANATTGTVEVTVAPVDAPQQISQEPLDAGRGARENATTGESMAPTDAPVSTEPVILGAERQESGIEVLFTDPVDDGGLSISELEFSTDDGDTWAGLGRIESPAQIAHSSSDPAEAISPGDSYAVRLRAVTAAGPGHDSHSVTIPAEDTAGSDAEEANPESDDTQTPEPPDDSPSQEPSAAPEPSTESAAPSPESTESTPEPQADIGELCETVGKFAAKVGLKLDFLGGETTDDGTSCTSSGISANLFGWLQISDLKLDATKDSLTISAGSFQTPQALGIDAQSFTIKDPITVQFADLKLSGSLSAATVAFKGYVSDLGVDDANSVTNLLLNEDGAELSASAGPEGDPTVEIHGKIEKDFKFTFDVKLHQIIRFAGSGIDLFGTASYAHKSEDDKVDWSLKGQAKGIELDPATHTVMDLELATEKSGVVTGQGSISFGANDPIIVTIDGKSADGVLTLNAGGKDLTWNGMPEVKFAPTGTFTYEYKSAAYGINIELVGAGEQPFAANQAKVKSPSLKFFAAPASQGWNLNASVNADILIGGAGTSSPSDEPLTIEVSGELQLEAKEGTVLLLKGTQAEGQKYELVQGVVLSGVDLSYEYDSTGEKPKRELNFTSQALVSLPMQGDPADGSVSANYNNDGLRMDITGKDLAWSLGGVIDLTDMKLYYQSFKKDFQPEVEGAQYPEFKGFQGLVALAAFQPEKDSFLVTDVGLTGKLASYVRVGGGEFEAAVLSQDRISVFGDPAAEEPSIGIEEPFLKATYAKPAKAKETDPKVFTLAMGGKGHLRYPEGDGIGEKKGLPVGAALDLTNKKFTASITVDKWENAGGIEGLTVTDGRIEISRQPASKKEEGGLGAAIAAKISHEDAPKFLKSLGLQKDAEVQLGMVFGRDWCARLAVGKDQKDNKDIALKPFSFAGDALGSALQIGYANFVYVREGSKCKFGDSEFDTTTFNMRGNILGAMPVDLNLKAKPKKSGEEIELETKGEGDDVEAAAIGPATIEDAVVEVSIDTETKELRGQEASLTGEGKKLRLKGHLPIGGQRIEVEGNVSKGKKKTVELALLAKTEPDKPLKIGEFEMHDAELLAKLALDYTKGFTPDGFTMEMKGDAKLLDTLFHTEVNVDYAGGTIQKMAGSISAGKGTKIGSSLIIAGGGTFGYSAGAGIEVSIGNSVPSKSQASFTYCANGAEVKDKVAKCTTTTGQYSFSQAFLDITPGGFGAGGLINLGSTFQGRLEGSYYAKDPAEGRETKIHLNGKELGDAKAGDFVFAVSDATINLPVGDTNFGLGIARYSDGEDHKFAAAMAFNLNVLGGNVGFDGEFDGDGLYRIETNADELSAGSFDLTGHVNVWNFEEQEGKKQRVQTTVDFALQVTLADWGQGALAGKIGQEDGAVGVRLSGEFELKLESVSTMAQVQFSNFPADSGFAFAARLELKEAGVTGDFAGALRKVDGILLYRAAAGVKVPIFEGIVAGGALKLDNCLDTATTMCVKPRGGSKATPQVQASLSVEIGGGLATSAIEGTIGFDGAWRFVGAAEVGASFGPWSLLKVVTVEAGVTMRYGVCIANNVATSRADDPIGCGKDETELWAAGLHGRAWFSITIKVLFSTIHGRVDAEIAGVLYPNRSKYCANVRFKGYKIGVGTCPDPDETPHIKQSPQIEVSDVL